MNLKFITQIDFRKVERLYSIVYPDKPCDKFTWLYNENPFGKADIFGFLDTKRDFLIANYAFIPTKIDIGDKRFLVGQAVDGMVHPDYRGKRVFNLLVKKTFPILKKKYDFLIGFPNKNSYGSLIKAGWLTFGDLFTWTLPLDFSIIFRSKSPLFSFSNPFLRIYNNFNRKRYHFPNIKIEESHSAHWDYDLLSEIIKSKNSSLTQRTSEFIDWRFQKLSKKHNYKIINVVQNKKLIGYICFKSIKKSVEIIDFIIELSYNCVFY